MALRLLPRLSVAATATRSVVATAPAARRALHSSAAALKDPQLGTYPDVAWHSRQRRKWNPKWWDPQEKRNFDETLHEQEDVLGVWAPDEHNVAPFSAVKQFAMAILVAATFASVVYATRPERPALPRTYPRDGLAAELGTSEANALAEGAFDAEASEEDEEEE